MMGATVWLARRLGGACLAVVLAALVVASSAGRAALEGPFAPFAGAWSGPGTVVAKNGSREQIRCRANDLQSEDGGAMSQAIVCASPSYRLDIRSDVTASGGRVTGGWREESHNISGALTGTIESGRFEGVVTGPNFTARVSLQSNGRRQTVTIAPNGGDISGVSIELERRDRWR